jgi:hypothetical protein
MTLPERAREVVERFSATRGETGCFPLPSDTRWLVGLAKDMEPAIIALLVEVSADAYARGVEDAAQAADHLANAWGHDPSTGARLKARGANQASIDIRALIPKGAE